jgi:hypothetical protein
MLAAGMAGDDDSWARRPSRWMRTRHPLTLWLVVVGFGATLLALTLPPHHQAGADVDDGPRAAATVTLSALPVSGRLPAGFVGVSIEYPALFRFMGWDPGAVNPVLVHLIANLAPGQQPVLRIGGYSTDRTWVPVRGLRRPTGVSFTLTPRRLVLLRAFARETHARLILGLDLEAGSTRLAVAEGRAMVARLGREAVQSLEIGNEPLGYRMFAWYRTAAGRRHWARHRNYDFAAFDREFGDVARHLPPGIGVAGPTMGGRRWMNHLSRFIGSQPRLNTVTDHTYPLSRCAHLNGSGYATLPRLLSPRASLGLAARVTRYVAIAHRFGLPFRLDEINSAACGGRNHVSNTFASALWAIDSLFALGRTGVSGVNFHTFHQAAYALFDFRRVHRQWVTNVRPIYYGLLLFTRAAPPGSRQLALQRSGSSYIRAWATLAPGGVRRLVLINSDPSGAHQVLVQGPRLPAYASILRLSASGLGATGGVQLGGQQFGGFTDGVLPSPDLPRVRRSARGGLLVRLPAASAAMLTLSA